MTRLIEIFQYMDKIKPVNLSKSDKKILKYLLNNGPSHGYPIKEAMGMAFKSIYGSLNVLTKEGMLIKESWMGKSRPGQDLKFYRLTLKGFFTALRIEIKDNNWKNIETIVEHWKELWPPVFKRWDLFKKYDVQDQVKERLELISNSFEHLWCNKTEVLNEFEELAITFYFFMPHEIKWINMMLSDAELKIFYIKDLEEIRLAYKDQIKFIEGYLELAKRS